MPRVCKFGVIMTLDEIFKSGKQFAKIAFKAQGQVYPMWIFETDDGRHIPITAPLETMVDKQRVAEALKTVFRKEKAVRYVALLEAWILETSTKEAGEKVLSELDIIPVREHPQKKEAIFITAQDKYHSKSGLYYIIRPKSGKPRLSRFKDTSTSQEMEGTFMDLLESGQTIQ